MAKKQKITLASAIVMGILVVVIIMMIGGDSLTAMFHAAKKIKPYDEISGTSATQKFVMLTAKRR